MNQTFPDFGFSQLLNNTSTDIVSASLNALGEAGSDKIILLFAVGTLPVILLVLVYVRTRKMLNASFVMLISSILLNILGYLPSEMAWILYIIAGLMITLSLFGIWSRK